MNKELEHCCMDRGVLLGVGEGRTEHRESWDMNRGLLCSFTVKSKPNSHQMLNKKEKLGIVTGYLFNIWKESPVSDTDLNFIV